jgi:hypothetical protein
MGGKVLYISSGYKHTCALMETRSIRCWGNSAARRDVTALSFFFVFFLCCQDWVMSDDWAMVASCRWVTIQALYRLLSAMYLSAVSLCNRFAAIVLCSPQLALKTSFRVVNRWRVVLHRHVLFIRAAKCVAGV